MAIVPANHSPGAPAPKPRKKQAESTSQRQFVEREKQSEDTYENNLRPTSLDDYIGQEELKDNLKIAVGAAKKRGEALNHLLFYGPPGLGKTTISMLIAKEMDVNIQIIAAPALDKPKDIVGLLIKQQEGDILFIDEIHRLNKITEEYLYPAMEDFVVDLATGKGHTARVNRLPLKRFTLIGATTQAGSISAPLRTRFGFTHRLRFYTHDEMQAILVNSAKKLSLHLSAEGALAIAERSRGTPRVGNRLLLWVRDFAEVKDIALIDRPVAEAALKRLHIDHMGLDPTDRELLNIMITHYKGGPVGVKTLATAISEDIKTVEEVYEPFLMQQGFLHRTPKGRLVTDLAYEHLGVDPPQQSQQLGLFD